METALHLALRLLLSLLALAALLFFGVFFAAVTAERRRRRTATRAMLGAFQPGQESHAVSRYAYAIEQQEREPLVYRQVRPIYFRGSRLAERGR